MRTLLERYLANRAPEGGGDGGGTPGGAGGSGGDGGQAAGGEGSAAGGAGAGGADAAAAAGQPYYPDGLRDDMRGTNDRETIDKLYRAFDGYRQRDAQRGQAPATAEEYAKFDADKLIGDMKLDAAVAPHLKQLADDPIMKAVGAFGLEHKVPAPVLQGIVATAYAEAQKAGFLDAYVDPAAERAALLPESAQNLPKDQQDAAIEARLQANEDFVKLLMQPGADGKPKIDPKVGEHALLMLMDTAAGNQFLEFFRGQMTGADRAQPLGGGEGGSSGGKSQREQLRARLGEPEMQAGHPQFDQAKYDALMADYRKLLGD